MTHRFYSVIMQLWFLATAPLRRGLITDIALSIRHIDYEALAKKGVKLVIFDLDDTLAHWHNVIPIKAAQKIKELHRRQTVKIAVLTNSTHKRVEKVSQALGIDDILFVHNPTKPLRGGFTKVLSHYKVRPEEAAMVGDRIATDMWGAKRAGIAHRILVQPYSNHIKHHESPFIQTLTRKIEQLLYGYFIFLFRHKRRAKRLLK